MSSEIEAFARGWPAQLERWERFAAWERERLAASPPDFSESLTWMSQSWDLARRHDPDWGSTPRVLEHCAHHAVTQRRLRAMRSPG